MKLFKNAQGLFAGADKDSIDRLSKIKVGEVISVIPEKREVRQTRSTKQNRYYWGVVLEYLVQSINNGLDKDQIHTVLKMGCFGVIESMGVIFPKRNTKDLTTGEMEQYLQWVREWATTRSIYIPMPNECGYDY